MAMDKIRVILAVDCYQFFWNVVSTSLMMAESVAAFPEYTGNLGVVVACGNTWSISVTTCEGTTFGILWAYRHT